MKSSVQTSVSEYNAIFQEEITIGDSAWAHALPGRALLGETFDKALGTIKDKIDLYLEDDTINLPEPANYKQQFVVPVKVAHA